jgi:cell division septation protein DedD
VPAQPAQAAPASGFRIQVGAMRTEAEARTAWDQVQRRHPEILGRLAPSFARVELGERGSFFRVQAGPLPSRDAARSACERLSKAGTVCFVVPPA